MNIACIACPARYAIADEKIVGRKVRIGCKRCAARLVIDGTTDPPSVRADTGTPSAPPAERYHLAISHDQRERGDLKRIVELYGRGEISATTLASREGMNEWLSLFEIEAIATALRAAGYSQQQAGAPSYDDDEVATRVGDSGYSVDDDEQTHVASSPLADSKPASHRFDDDDEATSVFDSEALRARGGWSEPASWRDPARQRPLASGEWRERGQSPLPPPPASSQPPGGWSERGLEDDEVTRMVAPLDERPERYREPMLSGPGFELRRPKSQSPAAKPSARPPSLPPEDSTKLTGQRSDDSVLFTLERLSKSKPASPPAQERADIDFSDVPDISLAPAAADVLGTAPVSKRAAFPSTPLLADHAPEPAPRRSSTWRIITVLTLLIGAAMAVLYATGRWPLVTSTASSLWQRVQGAR